MTGDHGGLIALAAGGTGGHLFPAFALAEELGRRNYDVDLITDERGDRYGTGFPARRVHQVPSATLGGSSPVAVTKTALTLSRGVWAAYRLLGELAPRAIVGFGGYPSFPPLLAARMRNIPSALHEQNAVLGRANRMLAGRVDVVATSFREIANAGPALAPKMHFTGNPVRGAVVQEAGRSYDTSAPGQQFNLIVFGGSQGARVFSDIVPPAIALLPPDFRDRLTIVQQAREEDLDRVRWAYSDMGVAATVEPFFRNMPPVMAAAHLVIARAGASSVAELAVLGRPSILVPLPHAIDNDQLKNAAQLAQAGGAWCIEEKTLDSARLARELQCLMSQPDVLARAAAAAKSQSCIDAVARLADLVDGLVDRRGAGDQHAGRREPQKSAPHAPSIGVDR